MRARASEIYYESHYESAETPIFGAMGTRLPRSVKQLAALRGAGLRVH